MTIVERLTQYGSQFHVQLKNASLKASKVLVELMIIGIQNIVTFWGKCGKILIKLHIDICDACAKLSTTQSTDFDFL